MNGRRAVVRRRITSVTDPEAVRMAMRRFDELGEAEFLDRYGYGMPTKYWLVDADRSYPSKAIMGVAFGFQHKEGMGRSSMTSSMAVSRPP